MQARVLLVIAPKISSSELIILNLYVLETIDIDTNNYDYK